MKIFAQDAQERSNRIWPITTIMVCIGFALILFLGVNHMKVRAFVTDPNPFWTNLISYIFSIGIGLLIAGAFYSAGGLVGFLFGIPKLLQNTSLSDEYIKENKPQLVQNDNLVQVSDWLTKIIVGVGLTQLSVMPKKILALGMQLGWSFSEKADAVDLNGRNSAIAIILYFSIIGFFTTYLWTRLFFGRLLLENEHELREQVEEAKAETQHVQKKLKTVEADTRLKEEDIKAVMKTFSASADELKQKREEIRQIPDLPDDPQKGKWGGSNESHNRKVSATVRETSIDIDWFNVNLEVISTDSNNPLTGDVIFHLHPSFPYQTITCPAINGKAQLDLVAFGAFTVGVECDGGNTRLELDLAEVANVPVVFKSR